MSKPPPVLVAWRKMSKLPLGARLFTRAVCLKAPYFSSIRPLFVELAPGHAVVTIRKHRAITNHLGTVHAIALCNLAEVAGGLMTEVSVPTTHRWIPKGMTVDYLKKAPGDVRGVARFEKAPKYGAEGFELPVIVDVFDTAGEAVFKATIRMWVSPKKVR